MLYALYSLENRNIIEYGGVSMKIFIIEDEPAIREELVQLLQKYGYQCDSSDDFHHIVQAALSSGANLILLDINLPYQDGFQVCREIRQKSNLPIIVLTSRNSDFDELMSLNIGADVILQSRTMHRSFWRESKNFWLGPMKYRTTSFSRTKA